jgi:putative spermidine/putrescine transport system ATP-binding protein
MARPRLDVSVTPAQRSASRVESATLRVEDVTKLYAGRAALDRITLSIPGNEYVSLLGPSGSGKTVLLRVIAGFEEPEHGRISFAGERIDGVPPHRRGIGFVFQGFALFPHLDVYHNIAFGPVNRSYDRVTDRAEARSRVGAIIELVGLAGLERRGVHEISGGQRQRVALARTLVTEPRLVLLDEPLGALDANLRTRMRGELRRIRRQLGVTFLHATGNETEALAMGDRVIVLDRGRVGQFDTPDAVYNSPADASLARLLNCYNLLPGTLSEMSFRTSAGVLPVSRIRAGSGAPAYAIRHDLIAIRPADQQPKPGEAGITAAFVASEYSGSAVMYFFQLADASVVEVQHHLSHRAPENFEPRRPYGLIWKVDDAVVFA